MLKEVGDGFWQEREIFCRDCGTVIVRLPGLMAYPGEGNTITSREPG